MIPARHLYSWWHSVSPANRRGSHDFNLSGSPNMILGHSKVSANRDTRKEVWLICPLRGLIWSATLVDSGPCKVQKLLAQ